MTPAIAIVYELGAVTLPVYSGFVFMQIELLSFGHPCWSSSVTLFPQRACLNRMSRLQHFDAAFERRFHIRFEREGLRKIGVGLGHPAHPQPEHPAIGVDLRVA